MTYLDLPPKEALKAMAADSARAGLDIHETAGDEYKNAVRDTFVWCADSFEHWQRVPCVDAEASRARARARTRTRTRTRALTLSLTLIPTLTLALIPTLSLTLPLTRASASPRRSSPRRSTPACSRSSSTRGPTRSEVVVGGRGDGGGMGVAWDGTPRAQRQGLEESDPRGPGLVGTKAGVE